MMRPMRILALSGSLRAASLNSMLLRAVARIAPADIALELWRDLGRMPLFNPDLDEHTQPVVTALRERLVASDAVLIASPEYAHGISGVLKNALDGRVGTESFVAKPVGLLNASPRATTALAALAEVLTTMSACVVPGACLTVNLLGSGLDEDTLVRHPEICPAILGALRALQSHAAAQGRQLDISPTG